MKKIAVPTCRDGRVDTGPAIGEGIVEQLGGQISAAGIFPCVAPPQSFVFLHTSRPIDAIADVFDHTSHLRIGVNRDNSSF